MITTGMSGIRNIKSKIADIAEDEKVSLEFLSELTGFPKEFIKDELMLDSDELTLSNLRKNMLTYLENFTRSV